MPKDWGENSNCAPRTERRPQEEFNGTDDGICQECDGTGESSDQLCKACGGKGSVNS